MTTKLKPLPDRPGNGKMDPHLKQLWIDALESDEYHKTTGTLCQQRRDGDWGFCCLGVLGNVLIEEGYIDGTWDDTTHQATLIMSFDGYTKTDQNFLPRELARKLGLLRNGGWQNHGVNHQNELASINDQSRTFGRVVKYIKTYL